MKRPVQHQIDSAAKKQFESTIPNEWAIRNTQETDYGLDYEIEVFENEISTGIIFKIQLKGTTTISVVKKGKYISFNFDINTLTYYLKEIYIPIIIIIADTIEKVTYWYNPLLDSELSKRYNSAVSDNKKSLNVLISTDNNLPKDCNKLLYEYIKSQNYLSARYLSQSQNYDFYKIVNNLKIDSETINSLQAKVDIVKLSKIQNLIAINQESNAYSYIDSILNTNESNIETKFQALLYREDIELKSINNNNPTDIDACHEILIKYGLWMKELTKSGPNYLKLFSLSLIRTSRLAVLTKNELSTYMNWAMNVNDNDIIWKSSLVVQRLNYIKTIEILYSQIVRLINIAFKNNFLVVIPKITIRLINSISFYIIRLEHENLHITAELFKSNLFKISELSCRVADYLGTYDDYEIICTNLLSILNPQMKNEFNNDKSKIEGFISEIKDEEIRNKIKSNFKKRIINFQAKNNEKTKIGVTIEDEIVAYKYMAKGLGIDLSNDDDEIARIVNIGLKDINPERVLKNCQFLFVRLTGGGLPAKWLKLPTAGFKMLICTKHKYNMGSLTLDSLYDSFKSQYCTTCHDCISHPQNWKWTRIWQQTQDELYKTLV